MSDKSDTPRTDAAEAWLITCRGPGRSLTYATVDKNDTLHWPLDQWATVETVSLVRESELAAVTAERDALAAAIKLKEEQFDALLESRRNVAQDRQDAVGRAEKAEAECERLRTELLGVQSYRDANPLGGPAKVFDAMADCIRAGDSYEAVMKEYGFVRAEECERLRYAVDLAARVMGGEGVEDQGEAWDKCKQILDQACAERAAIDAARNP